MEWPTKTITDYRMANKNNVQKENITQKMKDWATLAPLKMGYQLRGSRWVSSSCSTSDIRYY